MKIFGIDEANYYCSMFGRSLGDSENSIDNFKKQHLGNKYSIIREGTPLFLEYRDCSLREVERSLFFATSHFRRSLDLMITSSSPWAHITLYYGSWYASRALLGIFGCTIFSPKHVVDVNKGSKGQQELRFRLIGGGNNQQPTTYKGSHRIFWDIFYIAVRNLIPLVEPKFAAVLKPIGGNPMWQIENRNFVNYDMFTSLHLALDFQRSFSQHGFPGCLPGVLNTQYRILETLLEFIYSYVRQFKLNTDALDDLGSPGTFYSKVNNWIYIDKPPGLVRKTKKSKFINS